MRPTCSVAPCWSARATSSSAWSRLGVNGFSTNREMPWLNNSLAMAGAVGNHVPAQVNSQQRQVADHVEDLVPGWFVGVAQTIVDRPMRAKDHQVRGGGSQDDAHFAQLEALGLQ